MKPIIPSISYAVCDYYRNAFALPKTGIENGKMLKGFKNTAGLPYYEESIDGRDVDWIERHSAQYLDYRNFMISITLVILAVCNSKKRLCIQILVRL